MDYAIANPPYTIYFGFWQEEAIAPQLKRQRIVMRSLGKIGGAIAPIVPDIFMERRSR
ncbi:MAG: hypothetical protein F6K19_08440 [Cyanothece sp. SIO1E1]|nr:hypothetical protein [Cyanothece sp. SIO1E1]